VIGNDIVDLEDRDAQPGARHPRFDRRVFSVGERRLLESAGSDTRLPWIFWSAKESAYKVARRRRPDLGFSPVRFAVELDAGWRGCVRHGEDVYPVRVDVRPDCVHAVATEPWIGVDEVWAEVRRPEPGETPGGMGEAGSLEARTFALAKISERTGNPATAFAIERRNRIPILVDRGNRDVMCLSLSHHGRFVAYACAPAMGTMRMAC
jgi:hypothetical protein